MGAVSVVPLPPASLAAASLPRMDYADAYLARLSPGHHHTLDEGEAQRAYVAVVRPFHS